MLWVMNGGEGEWLAYYGRDIIGCLLLVLTVSFIINKLLCLYKYVLASVS